jgi:hypothetical protein
MGCIYYERKKEILEEQKGGDKMVIDRKHKIVAIAYVSQKIYNEQNSILFHANDAALLRTLSAYRGIQVELGCDANQLKATDLLIARIEKYQQKHQTKIPDVDPVKEASCLRE